MMNCLVVCGANYLVYKSMVRRFVGVSRTEMDTVLAINMAIFHAMEMVGFWVDGLI